MVLLALGAVILSRSPGESRVGPGAAVAPELAGPTAGAALPEDARAPSAPESTLAGSGSGVGMSVPSDSALTPMPAEGAPPPPTWSAHVLPTRVVFLDAASGREVSAARWWEPVITLRDGVISTSQARRSGDLASLMPPWGPLVVEPLADWVYLGSRAISLRRMPRAREGRMTVLLHPEVDVRVEILGPDGRVAEGAHVTDAFIAGTTVRPVREERAPDGTRRLRGIPYFAGETLHLAAHWTGPPGERYGLASRSRPCRPRRILPRSRDGMAPFRIGPESTLRAVIRLAGPTGLRDHNETDNDLPTRGGARRYAASRSRRPRHRPLQLLDRDGKPVPGVRVAVRGVEGTTDEDGRVDARAHRAGQAPARRPGRRMDLPVDLGDRRSVAR